MTKIRHYAQKAKFLAQTHLKKTGMTAAEVLVVTGAMLVSKKFLDFNTLFKNQIAADPTYAQKWFIKHQGAIKFTAGALAASYIKNPWIKLLAIGLAVEGAITETRVLTAKADGTNFFDSIGLAPQQSLGMNDLDRQMIEAAKAAENASSGLNPPGHGKKFYKQYGGGGRMQRNPAHSYPTAVGRGQENPAFNYPTAVGGMGMVIMPGIDTDNYGKTTAVGVVMPMQSSYQAA